MADGAFFSQTATWLGKPDTYGTTRRFMYSMPSANPKPVMRIVFGLIGVNAAVFGAWHYAIAYRDHRLLRTMNAHFKLSETNLKEGRYHTLITSAFSHTDFRHILFNMVRDFSERSAWQRLITSMFSLVSTHSAPSSAGSLASVVSCQTSCTVQRWMY